MAYGAGGAIGGDSRWLRLGIVENDALLLNWSKQVNLLIVIYAIICNTEERHRER